MAITENLAELDIDKIMRRGNSEPSRQKLPPSELWQVAAFYGRPVSDEIDLDLGLELNKVQDLIHKKVLTTLFQKVDTQLKGQRFVFPYYSSEIFLSQDDASHFIPHFIRKLIIEEKLPKDVLDENNVLKDDIVKVALVPLSMVFLEKEQSEFKSENK